MLRLLCCHPRDDGARKNGNEDRPSCRHSYCAEGNQNSDLGEQESHSAFCWFGRVGVVVRWNDVVFNRWEEL